MKYEITIPDGAPLEGPITVGRWRKEIGDNIRRGEVVLAVESVSTVLEIESEFDGMLGEIFHETGAEITSDDVLGIIEDEKPEPEEMTVPEEAQPPETDEETAEMPEPAGGTAPPAGPRISARAQWLAEASGVDIAALAGSGPGGRIIVGDVQAAIARKHQEAPEPAPEPRPPVGPSTPTKQVLLTPTERVWAQRMAQAHRDIPQYNITIAADATKLMEWRRARRDPPSITAIVTKLCADALVDHPRIFATFLGRSWRPNTAVHIAVAVDTPRGLLWPVLRDAANQPLLKLAADLDALAQRARDNALAAQDTKDPNFRIANLGMFGIESFNGIIWPGMAAILAVGTVQEEARVIAGRIQPRHIMRFTLGCDQRIIEGATGARFLARLKEVVEQADL